MGNVDIIYASPGRYRIFSPFGTSTVLTSQGMLDLAKWVEEHKGHLLAETIPVPMPDEEEVQPQIK